VISPHGMSDLGPLTMQDFIIPHPYWIETLSGRAFDLMNPKREQFDIDDIATALSRLCRYTGHLPVHYSVAQHCVLVAMAVPVAYRRAALLHDVEEAYLGDWSSPLKRLIRTHTRVLDHYAQRIREVAGDKYGCSLVPIHPFIVRADLRQLVAERRDLKPGVESPQSWGAHLPSLDEIKDVPRVVPWTAEMARTRFLDVFAATETP
jgi:uncharacterized protein